MTPRRSRGRRLVLVAVAAVALVLAACSEVKNNGQNSLEPKGPKAQQIYDLFVPILIIAIVVGIAITVATVFVALKFRYKKGVNENPKQVHGNTRLEIGWTVLPALLLAIIAVPTVATIFDLAENPGPSALQVTVEGKQWWWEFRYPDAKVVTADELIIPTGRDVYLKLTACNGSGATKTCNVIHSFWVPELAGKQDAIPGQPNHLRFTPEATGTFIGRCAEYCGLQHAHMEIRVIVQTATDFGRWQARQEASRTEPASDVAAAGAAIFQRQACAGCHTVRGTSATGTVGPDLTDFGGRETIGAGLLENNSRNLADWIRDAPELKPGTAMPSFHDLTDRDVQAIVAYLESLQ